MGITDLFSKRQKRLDGEQRDVYTYDDIPHALRVQIDYIIRDAIGKKARRAYGETAVGEYYCKIQETLCREYGVFGLLDGSVVTSPLEEIIKFFLTTDDTDKALDVIELCFSEVDESIRKESGLYSNYTELSPDEAIQELNLRFKEHAVGCRFESGQLIRIDSQIPHKQVVKPALRLLADKTYEGADRESRKAHEHYRASRYQECLNECLKAFSSTMKTICSKRDWSHSKSDGARKLIDTCLRHNLIPSFLQREFEALRAVLESGVPTARNKMSGHGQGTESRQVLEHFASYVLHMTAANIVYLVESERALG